MGLFKSIKSWWQSRLANTKPTRPTVIERLEPRILLSADGLLGITVPNALVDNTEQVIQYELLEINDASVQESSSNAMIERTELVVYDSDPAETETLELSGQGLQFNLVPASGMSQQAIDAFQEAADILSALFTDDIIININIDFKTLSSGILGQSSFMLQLNTYSAVYTALLDDQTSSSDNTATNFLPTGSNLGVYINLTSNNPNGYGSITPYLDNDMDANNNRIRISTANAKALGLRDAGSTATDATITFSDQYSWDFDRSDGIAQGSFDFVGIAIHEIVHAMGFISGVDYLDENPKQLDNAYTHISTLDLYRYSSNSISAGADIDWTADTRIKFFSIDGGMTNLATFSTGINYGDGRQASHWKDHLNLGIMDPTAAPGEFLDITSVDVIAWDVIGWDPSSMYLVVQGIPYSQDFSSGLSDAIGGWEYYSSNEGRIQIVDGRLRMDDSVGNNTYSLNEAILHLNLTGRTNVNVSLYHYSIYDENHTMPAYFAGHANGDGIAISIDGTNWIKISDLADSSHISLYLNLVGLFGASADLSDVRIKFQQYDNWPSPTDDGREFDNIQVYEKIFFDLNTWTENLMADDTAGGGFVINSITSAETISGGLTRAALFSGTNDVGSVLEGQFKVKTTFDDDFIGFVIGYNNNDHVSGSADYILIDWKQADNDFDFGAGTVTGHAGLALSTVSGAVDGEIWGNTYAWAHSGPVTEQLRANTLGSTGWNDNQTYDFKLVYLPDCVQLFINGTLELDYNGTFSDGSIGLYQFSQREIEFSNLSLSAILTVPYSQDFSSGLPNATQGWEYYSDNNGRIRVVNDRLRMDDSVGDGTYSLNEAIVHLNLTGQTNVNLSLDHYSIYDENHTIPSSFTGHYNGDGIAISIDGNNWIKISDLTGSSAISIDLDLVALFGASADLSDVRIKFQQYDNYPSPTDDGREFDNIQITAVSSGIVPQAFPYSQDFESGLPDASDGWEYYSDNDGRIQIASGRLRMDDSVGDSIYSLNEAILHVDLTGQTNMNLSLDHYSIYDENHNTMPANFTGHYKADGIAISIDGLNWIKISDLTGSSAISIDLDLVALFGASADMSNVRIKLQQYDNYPSTTADDGREFDNIQITAISSGVVPQAFPYVQDFNSGQPDASQGWEYYSDNEGRIQIVSDRLRMDDSVGNSTYSLNEAILHVDLTGQTNVNLSLDHYSIYDENHAMPTSFTGHYKGDGIAVSIDGLNWIKVSDLTSSSHISLDLDLVSLFGASADLSNVRIKFQQYDNYPSTTADDGREFDNIQITPVSSGIVIQTTPYSQDFSSGLPDASSGWEYYSDNDGRIQVVGGRLRMDDAAGDGTFSLNEAILHVNLTGKTNVTLTFDHFDLGDEVHMIPASFTGHYKGDGISLSVDGIHWVRINYFAGSYIDRSYALDAVIAQAQADAGITDLSDVRIKFQQYDNYPEPSDGREIDNVRITSS